MTVDDGEALLRVQNLKMHFPIRGGVLRKRVGQVHAVDGVSLTVKRGETMGLVGESGCGKTTVGRCILRLYQPTRGRVIFEGQDLLKVGSPSLRAARRQLQMIFQDPFESLNSRHTVGDILAEPFIIHRIGTPAQRSRSVAGLLERVGLAPDAASRFPHEFSGGQRQRIGIARAIALNPKLVVCDEPVSALDVSIQSQILNLLLALQKELGLSYLFIAHDLAVVKHVSDAIAVMYLGRIVERAAAGVLYESPLHPYTQALIAAIPDPDPLKKNVSPPMLSGDVPSPINPPPGCHFHPRCPYARGRCRTETPALEAFGRSDTGHWVACHFAGRLGREGGAS
ncbi:ABC transporter ATP-binding protein [Desulfosarcina alkanivorans]|uniref:ABC transporter ATP-binding protein n=2 Tax=Desulfosarcina alkanivorans TaxID=571177 RepID=A0A5K7YVK7_9BACT|nr:ABC transporter ATP-binding protein [Desulfosarcina alkanivorans]BBO72445.1 ABC transporter ATP-binding protein [Desulfosarcina alkanivorans]